MYGNWAIAFSQLALCHASEANDIVWLATDESPELLLIPCSLCDLSLLWSGGLRLGDGVVQLDVLN